MADKDLISRQALLEAYDRDHEGAPGMARRLIEEAPAVDAVEVVRCKNCKYKRDGESSKRAAFRAWNRRAGEQG